MARKWHPDKNNKGSEEEKKQAEKMFKDINEAPPGPPLWEKNILNISLGSIPPAPPPPPISNWTPPPGNPSKPPNPSNKS